MQNYNLNCPLVNKKEYKIKKWLDGKVNDMKENYKPKLEMDIYHFYRYYEENDQDMQSSSSYYISLLDYLMKNDRNSIENDKDLENLNNQIEKYQKNLIIKSTLNKEYNNFPLIIINK